MKVPSCVVIYPLPAVFLKDPFLKGDLCQT